MKIEIILEDYLTEADIKEECRNAVRECVKQTYQKEHNVNRLISNLSYEEVFKMVNDCIDEDLEEMLKTNCKKIIEDLSEYTVFRRPDIFERENSKAYEIMQGAMINNKQLIEQRVISIINEYDFREIKDGIRDTIYECIMDRLFKE